MNRESESHDRQPHAGPQNPYQSSVITAQPQAVLMDGVSFPAGMRRGWVGHIQILGVLMIIHGIIDVLISIMIAFYAWMMPEFMRQATAGNGGQAMPPEAVWMSSLLLGGLGAIFLIAGATSILGGVWAIQFRRRPGVLTGLTLGLAMLLSCYCLPTSLILTVYGMVVMLDSSVSYAFTLRKQGHEVKDIQQKFLELNQYVG